MQGYVVLISLAQDRSALYHATNLDTPSARDTCGSQPSNRLAFVTSAQLAIISAGWAGKWVDLGRLPDHFLDHFDQGIHFDRFVTTQVDHFVARLASIPGWYRGQYHRHK